MIYVCLPVILYCILRISIGIFLLFVVLWDVFRALLKHVYKIHSSKNRDLLIDVSAHTGRISYCLGFLSYTFDFTRTHLLVHCILRCVYIYQQPQKQRLLHRETYRWVRLDRIFLAVCRRRTALGVPVEILRSQKHAQL